jgi:Ni2+-binding GTPase involved in maturation of urease and hydrogenase
MQMHLVGGFLGSGKTTAIIQAARQLIAQGRKVGVVTNDKGKHLVDTAFFRSADIPTAEVAGGCFRCSFEELEKRLEQLKETARPDVIFAESVGSCADMAATVLEPLLRLQETQDQPTSFSVFTDVRLLRMWLQGEELPFSEEVTYIFEKQIEEAGLLVINKIDLLTGEDVQEVEWLARQRFPGKMVVRQNSLLETGVTDWLEMLGSSGGLPMAEDGGMDYDRYDAGSRQLAWLDEAITIRAKDALGAANSMISELRSILRAERIPVGHLKFFLAWDGGHCKLSFPTLEEPQRQPMDVAVVVDMVNMIVNGRVQTSPARLNRMVAAALEAMAATREVIYEREETAYFRPRITRRREQPSSG